MCGAITGGENRAKEKARLRKGLTVVVASPGRLLDHLEKTTAFHVNELKWLILDEADRLLDLGFEQKIRTLFLAVTRKRQAPPKRVRLAWQHQSKSSELVPSVTKREFCLRLGIKTMKLGR